GRAGDHDRDAVAVLGFVHVVRRDEHGRAAVRRLVDHLPELPTGDWVDAARRLVEQHDLRLVQQRNRKGELLLPAERQRANELALGVREAETVEDALGPIANLGGLKIVDAAVELDVLAHGEVVVEREALAHVPDVALDRLRFAEHVVSGDRRFAARRREETGEHADGRRLAGAVRAEEAEHLARTHVEGDVIDGREAAERARELLRANGVGHAAPRAIASSPSGAPIRSMNASSIVGAALETSASAMPCSCRNAAASRANSSAGTPLRRSTRCSTSPNG